MAVLRRAELEIRCAEEECGVGREDEEEGEGKAVGVAQEMVVEGEDAGGDLVLGVEVGGEGEGDGVGLDLVDGVGRDLGERGGVGADDLLPVVLPPDVEEHADGGQEVQAGEDEEDEGGAFTFGHGRACRPGLIGRGGGMINPKRGFFSCAAVPWLFLSLSVQKASPSLRFA